MKDLISKIKEPINRRRFLEATLAASLAIPLLNYSQANAYNYQSSDISLSDYKIVGNPEGITETKLGIKTINTKYFLKGDLSKLPSDLEEEEFYKIIEPLEKKTETLLIYKEASKEKIIKKFKKASDKMRKRVKKLKDDKTFYTKQDTENLLNFMENLDLKDKYPKGTRFVIKTGAGKQGPTYAVYDPDGNRTTFKEIKRPETVSSIRKFFNFQEHWFDVYEDSNKD